VGTEFVQAYDLERDREYVERVQKACVEKSEFALKSDHGLFGSRAWWEAIREGILPTHRVEGTIVTISKQGGWPEFEIDTDGKRSTWALDGKVEAYKVGKQARVAYVNQEFLKPAADAERETPIVIGIWVEP
jgi:hypothetical protein